MNQDEEWKQIDEYPDYFVSDQGNVYSERSHRLLNPVLQRDGYVRIALRNENGPRLFHVQRLVLEAFTGKHDNLEAKIKGIGLKYLKKDMQNQNE